jgi:hypothetical protein
MKLLQKTEQVRPIQMFSGPGGLASDLIPKCNDALTRKHHLPTGRVRIGGGPPAAGGCGVAIGLGSGTGSAGAGYGVSVCAGRIEPTARGYIFLLASIFYHGPAGCVLSVKVTLATGPVSPVIVDVGSVSPSHGILGDVSFGVNAGSIQVFGSVAGGEGKGGSGYQEHIHDLFHGIFALK